MSARFGDGARVLAGLAGALLGWRPDDFWNATPAELEAVLAALQPQAGASAGDEDIARLMEMFPDG
jgi:hypothetical protein